MELIDRPDALHAVIARAGQSPVVALDTEAASFHRYHDRIYLVQLSTPEWTAVIDPLTSGDLSPIAALLADENVIKIFHDADYDLRLFDKQFGFHARRLFDSRIASQFTNEPGIGLGALLEKYFGLKPDKRFQRADWSERPLSKEMLAYAAGDTANLCKLRELLLQHLAELGRVEWVEEEFKLLEGTRWTTPPADPERDFLSVKGAKAFDGRMLAILRELYQWREVLAAELDRAPFRIVGNEVLVRLAQRPVRSREELAAGGGIGREVLERRSGEILAAIIRGEAVPEDHLPRLERQRRRPPDLAFEARVDELKRTRNQLATTLSLAPGVLCPNGTLEAVARAEPKNLSELGMVEDVRQWQVKAIGDELLATLAQVAATPRNVAEV